MPDSVHGLLNGVKDQDDRDQHQQDADGAQGSKIGLVNIAEELVGGGAEMRGQGRRCFVAVGCCFGPDVSSGICRSGDWHSHGALVVKGVDVFVDNLLQIVAAADAFDQGGAHGQQGHQREDDGVSKGAGAEGKFVLVEFPGGNQEYPEKNPAGLTRAGGLDAGQGGPACYAVGDGGWARGLSGHDRVLVCLSAGNGINCPCRAFLPGS